MAGDFLFTSESVSEGHPDKVADQISDAVLDACLSQDPLSRVAAETMCTTGLVVLAGEITTNAQVNYIELTRNVLKRIGYGLITAAARCSWATTNRAPTSSRAWTRRTTIP